MVVPVVCSGAAVSAVVGAVAGASVCRPLPVVPCVVAAAGAVVVPDVAAVVVPEGAVVVPEGAADAAEDSSGRLTSAPLQAGSSSNAAAHTAPAMRCIRFIRFHPLFSYGGRPAPQTGCPFTRFRPLPLR